MSGWKSMETAPKDGTHILLLTADFGVVQGYWDSSLTNFYKSQEGWASYDPQHMEGDWTSVWELGGDDKRLYCGATPQYWRPIPKLPKAFGRIWR